MDGKRKKKSDKERAKQYRERHKEELRKKNRLRMKEKREKEKKERCGDPLKQEIYRKKQRDCKRRYRKKKMVENHRKKTMLQDADDVNILKPKVNSYSSPQTFGKAIKKVVKALPNSPTKKKAVISKLAKDIGVKCQDNTAKNILDSDTLKKNLVLNFYRDPEIVYTAPGMKEEMTVWIDGQKTKERKYYLITSLKEAHALFVERNPNNSIGFSTFCKLRPKNVLLLGETPADQCKCIACEIFFLKLKCLKIDYDSKTFWNTVLCDPTTNSLCWQGKCNDCNKGNRVSVNARKCSEDVTWKEWEKYDSKRLQCLVKEACLGELQEKFNETFSQVVKHINTKRIQSTEFLNDKCNTSVRVLQIDFAMYYICEFQNEVQSALWARGNEMLFTAATFFNGECKTYLICSDAKDKEKNTVAGFMSMLYENIQPSPENVPDVEEVIWSDGPSSEFKNKFMVFFLENLSKKYKKPFTWKYFATCHGKGVVDGIGGRVKSLVRNNVMSKSPHAPIVQNAAEFSNLASTLMSKTRVFLKRDESIERNDKAWSNANAIHGIREKHVVKSFPTGQTILLDNAIEQCCYKVDDWVLVTYDDKIYPGTITNLIQEEYEITDDDEIRTKYMEMAAKRGQTIIFCNRYNMQN